MDTSSREPLRGNLVHNDLVSTDRSTVSTQQRQSEGRKEDGDFELGALAQKDNDVEKQPPHSTATSDCNVVDWDGPADPQNPMIWSLNRKWGIIGLVSAVTFNT